MLRSIITKASVALLAILCCSMGNLCAQQAITCFGGDIIGTTLPPLISQPIPNASWSA